MEGALLADRSSTTRRRLGRGFGRITWALGCRRPHSNSWRVGLSAIARRSSSQASRRTCSARGSGSLRRSPSRWKTPATTPSESTLDTDERRSSHSGSSEDYPAVHFSQARVSANLRPARSMWLAFPDQTTRDKLRHRISPQMGLDARN